jgi:Macrocin-O-methyltransferase (TylF)
MSKQDNATGAGFKTKIFQDKTTAELGRRDTLFDHFKNAPMPTQEVLNNLGLFYSNKEMARMLFVHEMYKLILPVHGSIMEFGVRWGNNQALFNAFRGIYEPFNGNRKIIGFDTFEGFPSVAPEDGNAEFIEKGAFGVTAGYESYLQGLLDIRSKEGYNLGTSSYQLVKGDACVTVPAYLKAHAETVVALAYFDFDLYEPTKVCLEAIVPYLTKGSVVVFDELNFEGFPGETQALREVLGLGRYHLRHLPLSSARAYMIID